MSSDSYELVLMNKASGGDPAALTVLLAQTRVRLRNHIARRVPRQLRSTIDAEDIVQEAQVEAFRHIGGFVPRGAGSFYRWLATIAVRRLRNASARQRAIKRGGDRGTLASMTSTTDSCIALLDLMTAPIDSPSRKAAGREAALAVEQALSQLPEDYQRAVRLVYLEGRSVADAARDMGRTDRAIHNLCYKAKDLLRDAMGSGSRFLSSSG